MLGSSEIRDEYRRRNGGHSPAVHVNDLMFSILAATCASITGVQAFIFKVRHSCRIVYSSTDGRCAQRDEDQVCLKLKIVLDKADAGRIEGY